MPATRTVAFVAALGLLTIGGAAGCSGVFNRLEDGVVHEESATEVTIDGGGGDVSVMIDSTVKGVDVRRTVQYLRAAPSIDDTVHFDGGVVRLKTDCGSQCSASYVVRTPAAGVKVTGNIGSGDLVLNDVSDVDVELGSGDVTVERASGPVSIEMGSGDIRLTEIAGATTINSGSGDVTGTDLRGATTAIEVSSGDVTLEVPGTGDVKVVTGSGNIDVQVPERTTRITTRSSSGDQNVDVTADPDSPRLMELRTSSGDVAVRPSL